MRINFITPVDIKYSYTGTEWHVYEYARFLKEKGEDSNILVTQQKDSKPYVKHYKAVERHYSCIPKKTVRKLEISTFRNAHLIVYRGLPRNGLIYLPYSIHSYLVNILFKPHGQKYVIGSHIMQLKFGKMIEGNHAIYENLLLLLVRLILLIRKRESNNLYFHVINNEQIKYLVRAGINRRNIFYVPAMADIKYFKIAHNKSKKLRVIHIGGAIKESIIVLQIIKQLIRFGEIWHFEFYFIGAPQPDELMEISKRYKNIHVLGRIDDRRKNNILSKADAMIIPAYETFSKTMLEGLAAGLYIFVSNKNNAAKDVKEIGVDLWITKTGMPTEYIKPLLNAAKEKRMRPSNFNPNKRKNKELVIREFDKNTILPKMLRLFQEVESRS